MHPTTPNGSSSASTAPPDKHADRVGRESGSPSLAGSRAHTAATLPPPPRVWGGERAFPWFSRRAPEWSFDPGPPSRSSEHAVGTAGAAGLVGVPGQLWVRGTPGRAFSRGVGCTARSRQACCERWIGVADAWKGCVGTAVGLHGPGPRLSRPPRGRAAFQGGSELRRPRPLRFPDSATPFPSWPAKPVPTWPGSRSGSLIPRRTQSRAMSTSLRSVTES